MSGVKDLTPWSRPVSVYTRDEELILTDPDEAIRFSGGVAHATVLALKAEGQ